MSDLVTSFRRNGNEAYHYIRNYALADNAYIIYAFTLSRSNNEFDSIITYLIYALWSARESVEMTRRDHKSDNDVMT